MQTVLDKEIEKVRRTLNSFVCTKSLVDPEVIKLSERLDSLIVKYYENFLQR